MEQEKKKSKMDKEMQMMPGGGHMKKQMMAEGGKMAGQEDEAKMKKAAVMKMLDGMENMPAEEEVVKMIVEKAGVSEEEAKAMISEYRQSKKGMGGKMEYEGGGAMKMMRDPKDMVGMTMAGGAKIIS